MQAACRAIIVDTLPPQKQEIGNAWASRMVAGGHLIGYTMSPPRSIDSDFQGIYEFDEILVFLGKYAAESYLFVIGSWVVYHGGNYML